MSNINEAYAIPTKAGEPELRDAAEVIRELDSKEKIPGDGVPSAEVLAGFTDVVTSAANRIESASKAGTLEVKRAGGEPAVADLPDAPPGATGEGTTDLEKITPPNRKAPPLNEQTIAKVQLFLDTKLRGPVTFLTVPGRNKVFLMRVPTLQDSIDIKRFSGITLSDEMVGRMPVSTWQWQLIGELVKGCYGWVPLNSVDLQTLRANIGEPKKWPPLRPVTWLEMRDPYQMDDEILPLYEQYGKWISEVVPTREEISFYYASQK